jgi:hypothetical protein
MLNLGQVNLAPTALCHAPSVGPLIVEVDNAVVSLLPDTRIRRVAFWLIDFVDIWIGGMGGEQGRLQIVVQDKRSGKNVWVNHGYTLDAKPDEAFQAICDEIGYFTLDGFLRRRSPGYFSLRRRSRKPR